jgi:hypothetical protein
MFQRWARLSVYPVSKRLGSLSKSDALREPHFDTPFQALGLERVQIFSALVERKPKHHALQTNDRGFLLDQAGEFYENMKEESQK